MIDVEGLMAVLNSAASNGFDKTNLLKQLGQLLSPTVEKRAELAADVLGLDEKETNTPRIEPGKAAPKPSPVKVFKNGVTEKTRLSNPQIIKSSLSNDKPDTLIYTDKKAN